MVKQAKEQSAGCVGRGRTMARTIGAWITIRVSRAVSSATDLVGWIWFHWTTRSELARQRRALKHMPDWQLEDLGLCRAAARAEAMRPVWLARLPQIAPYQRGHRYRRLAPLPLLCRIQTGVGRCLGHRRLIRRRV